MESISEKFHFSPYYFHRMFSIIVGKTMAVHIRDRRLMFACIQLSATENSVLNIALDSGYNSAQSFSRAFKDIYGVSPREYRKQELQPVFISIDEMIMRFTNRLKGGVFLNPNIVKKEQIILAGTSGDGNDTMGVWQAFEKLSNEKPLINKISDNGYEVRLYDGESCTVYTGLAVKDDKVDADYTILKIPASKYASFDVYVANGYESENNAMDEWLKTNSEGYTERLLENNHYCVEFYDERFNGNEAGSIVEIWIPIEKK
ncbi:MAG: helix-turn-helix domain-containing protein [Eubacteriales bacterium]|nr:helix-turn-helix domain-containing protein [Eubacteriales bacterium]